MLHLLDIPHLVAHGARLDLPAIKPALLLCYLALQGNWVSRGALAMLVSPETDEESARHRVRVLLNRARALLWAEALEVEKARVRFQMPVDVTAFREAIGRADWRGALALYRRPLLDDFPVESEGLSEWFRFERERLETAWLEAVRGRAAELSSHGDHRGAALVWAECLERQPLHEAALCGYLREAHLGGQSAEALKTFQRFKAMLRQELDLEPTAETLALARRIEVADPLEPLPDAGLPGANPLPANVVQPPRLVGRDAEAARVRASRAAAVIVSGEPGVGKTRFLSELYPERRWLRGVDGLTGVSYAPLLTLARQCPPELLAALGPYRDDLARLLPELNPDAGRDALDAASGAARLLEAFARLFEAQNSEGRVLLVDDLQWLDAATLQVLTYTLARGELRLCATLRREETTPELAQTLRAWRAELISLEPLTLEGTEQLLSSLIGVDTRFPVFSGWLFARTGGNVFFALEVLKNLFETGRLHVQGEGWHSVLDEISRDYAEFDVPGSISDLVLRRLESLSEDARRLVQAASVLGEGFTLDMLEITTGLSRTAALAALEAAELANMLTPQGFRHDLLRQSIYAALSKARRGALHASAAALPQLEPLRRADHWLLAGQTAPAVPLLNEAGSALKRRGLLTEAQTVLERALALAPEDLPALSLLASIAAQSGQYAAAELHSARVLAAPEADALTRARALNVRASLLYNDGLIREAVPVIEEAIRITAHLERDDADFEETAFDIFEAQERYDDAVALLEPAIVRLRRFGDSGGLAMCLSSLAGIYDDTGRYAEALELHAEALSVARRAGAGYAQVNAALQMMWGLRNADRAEEALVICQEALALGEYSNTEYLRNALGASLMHLGRLEEAIAVYEHNADHGNVTTRTLAWGRLAGLYFEVDRPGAERFSAETNTETNPARLEAARQATDRAVECALQTQVFFAQLRAAIAALRFGTEAQVATMLRLVEGKRSPDTASQLEFEAALQAWQMRVEKTTPEPQT